jgi:hypothetical protein
MQLLSSTRRLITALLFSSAILLPAAAVLAHGGGGHGGGHGGSGHGTSTCGKSRGHSAGGFGSNTFDHFSPTPNVADYGGRAAGAAEQAAGGTQGAFPVPSSANDSSAQQRYDQRGGDGD